MTAGSERSPSPGSPVKEFVEFFSKRMSRDVSSDSMFPDELG